MKTTVLRTVMTASPKKMRPSHELLHVGLHPAARAWQLLLRPLRAKDGEGDVSDETWLVCGGRDFSNVPLAKSALVSLIAERGIPARVIHGGARGADRIVASLLALRGARTRAYPADWENYGRRAGPIRNQQMLDDEPDICLVVAFPGGVGTADMVRRSRGKGIEVVEVDR